MAKTLKSFANTLPQKASISKGSTGLIATQWFPIGLVLLNALLSTCAEVLLKIGATQAPAIILPPPIGFVSAVFSFLVGVGIVAYIGSLTLWLIALPRLPL